MIFITWRQLGFRSRTRTYSISSVSGRRHESISNKKFLSTNETNGHDNIVKSSSWAVSFTCDISRSSTFSTFQIICKRDIIKNLNPEHTFLWLEI